MEQKLDEIIQLLTVIKYLLLLTQLSICFLIFALWLILTMKKQTTPTHSDRQV